jgi:hypothetical protein
MEPPVITRHRRPFLAPVWLSMLTVVVAIVVAVMVYRRATTTVVVLVRPVEKEIGAIDDPPLTPEGEQRAQRLARMFGETAGAGHLKAIYVSASRLAQQTAAPLADRLAMRPVVVPVNDVKGTAARVLREHDGEAALVIATSDSVPQLLRVLSGRDIPAARDDEYDTVFVVSIPTFGDTNVLRFRY